ncbi:MPN449 family protein [Mycoplasmoides pneumoniae]|uniref:MPN449 family protein n=1 Tax=Mycoplasmoides pneumoniae TaxID=2104 RepID=UPI0006A6D169|nr:hypothetical protein [Mycoplasmoides pneumoniae]ALA35949.1 hypothetical protein F539_02515 [Mycoplasmoides pneumoniae FH]
MTFSDLLTKLQDNLDIVFNANALKERIQSDPAFAKTIREQLKLLYFLEQKQAKAKTKKKDFQPVFQNLEARFVSLGQTKLANTELNLKLDLTDATDLANYLPIAVCNLFNRDLNSFSKLSSVQPTAVEKTTNGANKPTVTIDLNQPRIHTTGTVSPELENFVNESLEARARQRAFMRVTSERMVGKIFEFQFKSQWIKWAQLAIFISMLLIEAAAIAYLVVVNLLFYRYVNPDSNLTKAVTGQNNTDRPALVDLNGGINLFFPVSASTLITLIFLGFGSTSFLLAFQGKPYSFATRSQTFKAMHFLKHQFGVTDFPRINDNYRYKVRIKWIFWTIFLFVALNALPGGNIITGGILNPSFLLNALRSNELKINSETFKTIFVGFSIFYLASIIPFALISIIAFVLSPKPSSDQTNEVLNRYVQEEMQQPFKTDCDPNNDNDLTPPAVFG